MTKIVPLTQGYEAQVDDDLCDVICAAGPWRTAHRKGKSTYAVSHTAGYMHQLIMALTLGHCPRRIDHKK